MDKRCKGFDLFAATSYFLISHNHLVVVVDQRGGVIIYVASTHLAVEL